MFGVILINPKAEPKREKPRRAVSLLLALAGVAFFASLFFPIWHIQLEAPQYPEGMGMYIWPRTIVGENPHDLDVINELNHYIGMKKIIPESIPELRFIMPLILFFGIASLFAAIRPRILPTAILLVGLSGAGAVGLADFWRWEYDYGHNLDPMAAIKIPGVSYQPPLIGEARLLNFLSISWPAAGGCLLFSAGLLIAVSLALLAAEKKGWPAKGKRSLARRSLIGSTLPALVFSGLTAALPGLTVSLGLGLSGCGQKGPAPIVWGEDACHFCKMILVQKGFAAERVNPKGKVHKFDSIECLLGDIKAHPLAADDQVYVSDWSRPEAGLLAAGNAVFLEGGNAASPMGGSLAGFADQDSALAFRDRIGGKIVEWERLQSL